MSASRWPTAAALPASSSRGCRSATVDPRFIVDDGKLDLLAEVIRRTWPVEIDNADLQKAITDRDVEGARAALLEALDLGTLA